VFVITFSETFYQNSDLLNLQIYVWKQIDVQTLINVQSSNPCPISMSHTSVLFQIIKLASNSQSYGRFSLSALILTLTNKSAIVLRIWKGRWFDSAPDLNLIHTISFSETFYQDSDPLNLQNDLEDMIHDYTVLGKISSLVGTLKSSYQNLPEEMFDEIMSDIQRKIQVKNQQLQILNSCTIVVEHTNALNNR
jgi:hypothetical protein